MNWIATAHGHEVPLRAPRPAQIVIADVAHHLALVNRFCGATYRPYSVAEHSLLVAEICEREFTLPLPGVLAALMHDAHEAWIGDMSSPVKREMGMEWERLERRFENTVRSCFSLHVPSSRFAEQIKRADLMALATERRDLLSPTATPWVALQGISAVDWIDLRDSGRAAWTWQGWRQAFLDRYEALDFGRQTALKEWLESDPQAIDIRPTAAADAAL